MRYYLRDDVLIVRGNFHAASSGVDGGIADVRTILNITVPRNFSGDAALAIDRVATELGLSPISASPVMITLRYS